MAFFNALERGGKELEDKKKDRRRYVQKDKNRQVPEEKERVVDSDSEVKDKGNMEKDC